MNMTNRAVNALRILSADQVQKANSGHPGLPLGAAPVVYTLFNRIMKDNPADTTWRNRDRFILSAGHGSTLLYSMLHLGGYGLELDELKNFRQLGSKTPGHPEWGLTAGVEATTGPLGAGMAMAVGMAMGEKHLAARFNKPEFKLVDHFTYVLGGDGCMMEGISSEAFSLAGTLGLSKLIVLYDSNRISIEGSTDIAFTENVQKRMEAFGFQLLEVKDGNDVDQIEAAIREAQADTTRPSFITVHTEIGYGCPAKQGKASAHGEPLGVENVAALRQTLGWEEQESFVVPADIYVHYEEAARAKQAAQTEWEKLAAAYAKAYPQDNAVLEAFYAGADAEKLLADETFWAPTGKAEASRNVSGDLLNLLKDSMPGLFGGSADLAPSNKTYLNGAGDFSAATPEGRNIHFGVREIAMAGMANGLALYGGYRAYCATFFVFSDYIKPMARLASIMGLPVIYVLTHDSIGVGEDGETHQPIEQTAQFRAMPNCHVFRPADRVETAAAWYAAVTSKRTPTALLLSRQNLPALEGSSKEALKGGYILEDSSKEVPDAILMASGSEVALAVEAKKTLAAEGIDVRVVSMPCMDIFEEQADEYKEAVLPKAVRNRVAVEALTSISWGRYVGLDGRYVTLDRFGASAPADQLFKKFGITAAAVAAAVKEML
ncbi:MAG: transketolase [Lachnospiraceae bacterium]|nr:transketolase [Lachnospiraceae bacterium]MDY5741712.1 transketolase [Lachnospiraceae bacterium]